ncbi:Arabinose 5-phosphate isomerase KdsD [Ewingella americana]|uniref:Arabinose 5-phosphate isomerase KdsD n=1 Tax=Ewingella americana TaxID=41202 RepID=A0A377NKQ6_9GAMM|nr:Arabinose 5-phosphate isomerase KdsD [Ewingella americana]
MTPGGIRVRPNLLAVDALNLMQDRHITCVMVADGDHLLVCYICTTCCALAVV